MGRRLLIVAVIAAVFVLGVIYAWRMAFVDGAALLFNSGWWLVLLAPFAGVLAAGLTIAGADRPGRSAQVRRHWSKTTVDERGMMRGERTWRSKI